jgi:small-conductance mechanosensitive channel
MCMTEKKFRAGDPVEWNSHGGIAKGKVKKKLTSRTSIKGHQVAASPDNPEYLVETDGGGQAAHKPEALRKGAAGS